MSLWFSNINVWYRRFRYFSSDLRTTRKKPAYCITGKEIKTAFQDDFWNGLSSMLRRGMIIIFILLGWPKRAPKQARNSTNEEKHVAQSRAWSNSNTAAGFGKTQHLMQEASSVLTGWYGGQALYPVGAWPCQGQCEVVWVRAFRVDMWLTTQRSRDLSRHAPPTGTGTGTPHQSVRTDEASDSSTRANVCVSHLYWAWKCSWTKLWRSRGCCVLAELGLGGRSSELGPCTQRGQMVHIYFNLEESFADRHTQRQQSHSFWDMRTLLNICLLQIV